MFGYYATSTKKRTVSYWFRALVSIITTTVLYFLLSYSVLLNVAAILLALLLANIVANILFIYSAITKSISRHRVPPIWIVILIITAILSIPLNSCYQNGLFFGKKTLEASFVDEYRNMDLVLYNNSRYIIFSKKWTIAAETFSGSCSIHGDTIVFDKEPIPGKHLISKNVIREGNRIYFNQSNAGEYNKTFYFFLIEQKTLKSKKK